MSHNSDTSTNNSSNEYLMIKNSYGETIRLSDALNDCKFFNKIAEEFVNFMDASHYLLSEIEDESGIPTSLAFYHAGMPLLNNIKKTFDNAINNYFEVNKLSENYFILTYKRDGGTYCLFFDLKRKFLANIMELTSIENPYEVISVDYIPSEERISIICKDNYNYGEFYKGDRTKKLTINIDND